VLQLSFLQTAECLCDSNAPCERSLQSSAAPEAFAAVR